MSELKPCPFCGGAGRVVEHKFNGLNDTFGVECLWCRAWTWQFHKTEKEAVDAWNRRVKDGSD